MTGIMLTTEAMIAEAECPVFRNPHSAIRTWAAWECKFLSVSTFIGKASL
jgi:hypothetical protein